MVKLVKIFKTEKTIKIQSVRPPEVCGKVLGEKNGYKSVKTALLLFNVIEADHQNNFLFTNKGHFSSPLCVLIGVLAKFHEEYSSNSSNYALGIDFSHKFSLNNVYPYDHCAVYCYHSIIWCISVEKVHLSFFKLIWIHLPSASYCIYSSACYQVALNSTLEEENNEVTTQSEDAASEDNSKPLYTVHQNPPLCLSIILGFQVGALISQVGMLT